MRRCQLTLPEVENDRRCQCRCEGLLCQQVLVDGVVQALTPGLHHPFGDEPPPRCQCRTCGGPRKPPETPGCLRYCIHPYAAGIVPLCMLCLSERVQSRQLGRERTLFYRDRAVAGFLSENLTDTRGTSSFSRHTLSRVTLAAFEHVVKSHSFVARSRTCCSGVCSRA